MEKINIENKKASFKASMKQQLIVQQGGSKYGHRDTQIGDDMFDEKYLPKFNEFSQRDKLLKTTLISKYIDSSICCDTREIPKLKIPLGCLKNESGPETFDQEREFITKNVRVGHSRNLGSHMTTKTSGLSLYNT